MTQLRIIVVLAGLLCALVHARAEPNPEGGWSADLLKKILRSDTGGEEPVKVQPGEMLLHTYHLTNLRVGEAGRSQNVITILLKLLPAGSSMNSDVTANCVHILTTPTAHKAVWDYLSAVDVPEAAPAAVASVPDEVRLALEKLAQSGEQSRSVLTAVSALKTDVSREFAAIDARQRSRTIRLVGGGLALAVVLLLAFGWMLRKQPAPSVPSVGTALTLAPDQLATALTPVQDKMRTDMLGLLNEVAIKLQAQHNEQQKLVHAQQLQIEDARQALAAERRQFISEAGSMVDQAVERVDATTARLARQQDKVSELVQELQSTVRELDDTKDSLRNREIELEQERAKIAALSILLEEGGGLPPGEHPPATGPRRVSTAGDANQPGSNGASVSCPAQFPPCTNRDHPNATDPTPPALRPNHHVFPARLTFLPPEHPET